MRVNIKPLSVNKVFQGRRFRTKAYDVYETQVRQLLPNIDIPKSNLSIKYVVGYSNKASDIDNCIKPFQDILSKHYGFNDNTIYHIEIDKVIVKKGNEFIEFEIYEHSTNNSIQLT